MQCIVTPTRSSLDDDLGEIYFEVQVSEEEHWQGNTKTTAVILASSEGTFDDVSLRVCPDGLHVMGRDANGHPFDHLIEKMNGNEETA